MRLRIWALVPADESDQRTVSGAFARAAILIGLSISAIATSQGAFAQAALGSAVQVLPSAIGELDGGLVTIVDGSELFEGQTISTDANGEVQIIFSDETRMVIGPNSSLVIERYLLRDPNTVSDFVVNALGGTFRFISGNSPSENYTIRTPTGTIGIRGTALDFVVDWLSGKVDTIGYWGRILICPALADCAALVERCSMGTIAAPTIAQLVDNDVRDEIARVLFRYSTIGQGGLRADFRVANAYRCAWRGGYPPPVPPEPPPLCNDSLDNRGSEESGFSESPEGCQPSVESLSWGSTPATIGALPRSTSPV